MPQREVRGETRLRLSESDLRFVVQTVATERTDHDRIVELVRDKPDIIDQMLNDEKLFRRLMYDEEAIVKVSPWLLFTVLIRRAAREMPHERFTIERIGVGERVPVFDSERVASLLRDHAVRDYLADLLASFVRTESAVFYYKAGRRYRRRAFSDLDVDDMITLAGTVAEEYRFPFYRRIGDICLFTAGVFPEHLGGGYPGGPQLHAPPSRWGRRRRTLQEYEQAAERFYNLAAAHPVASHTGVHDVLATLAVNFSLARKPLNYITDHYIRLHKARLFGEPG